MAARWAEALLKLQAVDMRIRDLNTRMTLLPKEMTSLKEKRDAAVAEVNAAADAARRIELARKGVESEIARLNAESEKLRQQSAMVKKNTEYQAMLNTIALNRNKVSDLETRELELIEEFEQAKAGYRKLKTKNETVVSAIRTEFEELVAFAGEIKTELARLEKERPADIRGVDADTLARYNRLLKGKDGSVPLAKVENGICGSCHLRVTPQVMNDVQKGAIVGCANCMHLLYSDDVE